PRVAVALRDGVPLRIVPRVFAGLLVPDTVRSGLEKVHVGTVAARIDGDADEVVERGAAPVRALRRDDRYVRVIAAKQHANGPVVVAYGRTCRVTCRGSRCDVLELGYAKCGPARVQLERLTFIDGCFRAARIDGHTRDRNDERITPLQAGAVRNR